MTDFVANMSEADRVLHLYVEVRTVGEGKGKELQRADDGNSHLMHQCPDVLPHSQKRFVHSDSSQSPDYSPVTPHQSRAFSQSLPPSRCSSRHTVNFQLPNHDAPKSPSPVARQDKLYGSLGQLPGPGTPHQSLHDRLTYTNLIDRGSYQDLLLAPPSSAVGRLAVPSTPTSNKKFYEGHGADSEHGKTSVVRFGYVEKANVNRGSQRTSLCHCETDKPFHEIKEPVLLRKRNSDPGWHHDLELLEDPIFNNYCPLQKSQMLLTPLKRSTLETVAKDATYKALEEFGSPELRCRFASYCQENCCPTLSQHHQCHHCRSPCWSPILHRKTLTLPSQNPCSELNRGFGHTGVIGSHASEQFSSHAAHSSRSARSHSFSQSQHRHWVENESTKTSSNIRSPLPAGRPTDIQHTISTKKFPTSTRTRIAFQPFGHIYHSEISCNPNTNSCSKKTCYNQAHTSCNVRNMTSSENDTRHFSSSINMEMGSISAVDGTRFLNTEQFSPSPVPYQAESSIVGSSKIKRTFNREIQPHANTHLQSSPEPQAGVQTCLSNMDNPTTPTSAGYGSPLLFTKCLSSPKSLSLPESLSHTDLFNHTKLQSNLSQNSNMGLATKHPCELAQNIENLHSPNAERRDYQHVLDKSSRNSPEVAQSCIAGQHETAVSRKSRCEANGNEPGDENQNFANRVCTDREEQQPVKTTPKKGNLKIESSTLGPQEQQDSSCPTLCELIDSRAGTQVGRIYDSQTSNVLRAPASRSEKIAKAKWEFLFGAQSEECCCSAGALPTAPIRPLPGPGLRRVRESAGQRLLHHKVQQIEVELFTPDPRGSNSSTGIIRRTLKYSETDLDAVPLRCYRETDLDQVMQAEVEVFEQNEAEVDSAFGSDRSILGASSFSPEDGGGKKCDSPKEEQRVAPNKNPQFERTSKEGSCKTVRPLEAVPDSHCPLKSPVSLGSPRCSSDSNLDSFSRHFESIMESHRAKGTSYSSLDSMDILTSGSTSVFTFDLPTLTPEIQSQISETAKQLIDLSFAPLSRPLPFSPAEMSCSEMALSASGEDSYRRSKNRTTLQVQSRMEKGSIRKDSFKKASSVPSLHSSLREHVVKRPPELLWPQADVAERLARSDSIDALSNGIKPDLQAAKRLAKRLYTLDGFKKSDVARHLSKNNEFSHTVAEEYLSNFDFTGLSIDQALRLFLRKFALIGETQERERILAHFSYRYRCCNPECLNTEDSVHTLICAVMLLNTDLHGNNVGKRMSCSQFISNLEGLNNGKDFPKELLKTLYTSIKNEKLQWTIDEEEVQKSVTELPDARKDSASHTMKRLGTTGNPLVGMAQQANDELYKSGFLVRKVHADQDGKKTPRGKRGWRSFYATLKGLVLYLQKDEYRTGHELTQEDVKNAVSIHHSLAMRAADYSKRPNVFYLRTADWRVFLFQAPSTEQMQSWITRINVVSAMFSAPPFPAAIGSQKRFSRPLLPGSNTKLSQEEQLKSHENRFRVVSSELAELIADSKVRCREVEEQKQRQEYLEFEKTRYGTYAMLMRAKLQNASEDIATFESRLLSDGTLHRAHSSPALPQYSAVKDKSRSTRSKSLKVTSTQSKTKDESNNVSNVKPDARDDVP